MSNIFSAKLVLAEILHNTFHTRKIDRTLLDPYQGELGNALQCKENLLTELVDWMELSFRGELKACLILNQKRLYLSIERV